VIRFNNSVRNAAETYARFTAILRTAGTTTLPLVDWVSDLVARAKIVPPIVNARSVHLETLAVDAAKQWTGQFNPRPLQAEDIVALYRHALGTEPK
jgi:alcohol dehydrogenase